MTETSLPPNGHGRTNKTASAASKPNGAAPPLLLSPADMAMFAAFLIPPELLIQSHIERVTDRTAREKYGITGPVSSDMAGVAFPYFSPITGYRTTVRVRRDYPEYEDGRPKNKYVTAYGDPRHLYILPGCVKLLPQIDVPAALMESEKSALVIWAWSGRPGIRVVPIAMGGCWAGAAGSAGLKMRRVNA